MAAGWRCIGTYHEHMGMQALTHLQGVIEFEVRFDPMHSVVGVE